MKIKRYFNPLISYGSHRHTAVVVLHFDLPIAPFVRSWYIGIFNFTKILRYSYVVLRGEKEKPKIYALIV